VEQLSAKVFKLSFEYLHIYRRKSSVVNKELTLKAKAKDLSRSQEQVQGLFTVFAARMASPGFDARGHKN